MLSLNFTTCVINGCSQIQFTETTGLYNASTNTGGWGTPNALPIETISFTLILTDPNGTVYTLLLDETLIFDANGNNFNYVIPTDIIGIDTIIDGQWTITYEIVNNGGSGNVTYSKTKVFLFTCNSECCVASMLNNIDSGCDCCNKDVTINDYLKASVFLDALKKAAKCGAIDTFNKITKIINKLCKNKDCKTCK
jgi:hypothetical protein